MLSDVMTANCSRREDGGLHRSWVAGSALAAVLAMVAIAAGCGADKDAGEAQTAQGAASLGPALLSMDDLGAALRKSDAVILIDTRGRGDYDAGHLEGSVSSPIDDLDPPVWAELDESMRSLLGERLAALGVREGVSLVAIDEGTRDGFARAAHACWLVSLAGAGHCHVLEGGLDSWRSTGHELAMEPTEPTVEGSVTIAARPATFADMELMRAGVFDGRSSLVGVLDDPAAPSIPGAWHVPLSGLVDDGGRVHREKLAGTVRDTGLMLESEAIVFGEGPRDGAAGWFLLGPASGFEGARLYPGGMRHWSTHPHLPRTGGEMKESTDTALP